MSQKWVATGPTGYENALDVGTGVLFTINRYETGCTSTFIPGTMLVKNEAGRYDIVPRPAADSLEAELRKELELYREGVINRQNQIVELGRTLNAVNSNLEYQTGITAKKNIEIANLILEINKLKAQLAKGGLTLASGEGGELSEVKETGVLSFITSFIDP